MGEISESILEGSMCQSCGVYLGEGGGFPRYCAGCQRDHMEGAGPAVAKPLTVTPKVECPGCKRMVKVTGISDHYRVQHMGPKNG